MDNKKVGAYKKRSRAATALSMEDYKKLLAGLRDDKEYQMEMFCRLAFVTALRVSDVLSLRWSDFLGKSKIDFIEQKTKKSRTIPFDKSVVECFNELYKLMGSPDKDEYVMISRSLYERTGVMRPLSTQHINRRLKPMKFKYKLDVDVSQFSTHAFRKTFGRYVYESNNKSFESLNLLNMIFKHSNISTTQRYLGIVDDEIGNIYQGIKF